MNNFISRRTILVRLAHVSLGGVFTTIAANATELCADPKAMDSSQQSLRTSLHYVEHAPDQNVSCSSCGFFQSTNQTCGTCVIFSGPVNSKGHCDSWAAKS